MKRPWVLLNMAMTADGKIATANRAVHSFGSRRDQAHLLELRATVDAVLCGAHTAGTPEVTLGPGGARYQRLREKRGLQPFNLRVVVSGQASLPPEAEVFSETRGPLVVLVSRSASADRVRRLRRAGARIGCFGQREVDLRAALCWLSREWEVRSLVCEGGAALNDAMFRADLIDEVHLTLCPWLFGGRDAPTLVEGLGFPTLSASLPLDVTNTRRIGSEWFTTFRVRRAHGPG